MQVHVQLCSRPNQHLIPKRFQSPESEVGKLSLTSLSPATAYSPENTVKNRGGVEDTRLEAKAKDTKKIRGQGQPFRGQTLSRPRTGMLEAKAKDQEHRRKRSQKKKKKTSSKKFF